MYQFKYILNDKDYWEFNKYYISNARAGKIMLWIIRLFIVIACINNIISTLKNPEEEYDLMFAIILIFLYAIVAVIFFFIAKILILLITKIYIKLMKKDGKLPYGSDVYMQFDDDFFVENTNETEIKTKYESVEKIVVYKNYTYIYISSIQAFIIPSFVFETKEQKSEFLTFINHKIGKI